MFITSTSNAYWQPGKISNEKGFELSFGEEQQTIRGFGCCFSELGAKALNKLSPEDKKNVLDELFNSDGGAFNYCRTPIGASDFALDYYSYNDNEGDFEMEKFSIERDQKLLLPLIKEGVKRRHDMQMFASPWCPPTWLKTHNTYSFGVFNRTEENLKAYALYFKKYVQAYHKEGIPLIHIHPQNEPCSTQKFPSCEWRGDWLADFVGDYLGPALEGENVDIFFGTINGPESDSRYSWTRYCDYLGYAMQESSARKYIKGVGYQWAGRNALSQTHEDYPNLEIIQTESQCGDGQNTWEHTMFIYDLARIYFRHGTTAYVYWNIALEEDALSTWGWKQNSLITVKDGKAILNPEYYLMKHFSHFVKRGAKYVKMNGEFSSCCISFINPDGSKVVLANNPYKTDKIITIEDKSYILPSDSISTILID